MLPRPCQYREMPTTPETRLPQSAFDALVRMDAYERQRLEAITARSAQLTGSAAIVAALAGFAVHSSVVVVAVALFVVAAALGVAAQWPLTGEGLQPRKIISDMEGTNHVETHYQIALGIVLDIETTRSAADTRSLLNRVGLIVQVAGLALVFAAVLTTR